MPPHGEADSTAGYKHTPDLAHRIGRRAPDAAKAGHHVEGGVVPWKGVHVPDPDVRRRVAIAGHRHEPLRGIDASANRPAQMCQLKRQAATTSHVEEPVTVVDAEPVVHHHVVPAVPGPDAEAGLALW